MAVYYVYSAAAGSGNGSSWANAFTTLTLAFATEVAGDTLYVAHDHSESSASILTLTSSGVSGNPTKIICVNRAGSVPPVSADRRATAQVATTGNITINLAGDAHYDGIIFVAGNSTGTANISLGSASNGSLRFDNCSLRCGSTGVSGKIIAGGAVGTYNVLVNTSVSFANAGQSISVGSVLKWFNTTSALLGTIPTNLFTSAGGGDVLCIGLDLSAAGSGKTIVGNVALTGTAFACKFIDCKLNASVTKSTIPAIPGSHEVDFIRSGSAATNYTVYSHRTQALLIEETTIVRTGGASDGTTAISWKIVTTANCSYTLPFDCPPIALWNDTTGSAKTATVEGIWGGGAVPLDSEIWVELEYLSDASSPMGSFVDDGTANLLVTPANQSSSSATWGGSTTKFALNVTFTAQQKGWVYARVRCAKASSTFYIDPLITLT